MDAVAVNFDYSDFSKFIISPDTFVSGVLGGLLAVAFAFLFVFVLVLLGLYIYVSLAYTSVGKKAKLKVPELAWIPFVGPNLIAFQTAKMHWWPWILLAGLFIPVIGFLALIVFAAYSVIWHWKMFEAVRRPGWWAILQLIPIVGLVLIGIAAWGKRGR